MNQEQNQRRLAAAIPLLLIASVLAVGPVEAQATEDPDALLAQLQQNLDLAGALTGTDDPVAAAKTATAWQAATLGVELESVQAPRHDAPSQAVQALLERHDVVPAAQQSAQIAELDDLPAAQRSALAGVVDAFLALEDATRIAYQDTDLAALAASAEGDPEDPDGSATSLVDAGVQVGLILGTRNDFLDATQVFQEAFGDLASPSTASAEPGVDLCPAIALDLDGTDTTYNDNCALTLDVGGHDTYLNNAGGSKLLGAPDDCTLASEAWAAAALVDLTGDDQYISGGRCGHNGGGDFGVGFLLDQAGNDTYTAGNQGTNGGGNGGIGFLLDQAGSDTYTAGEYGTNGGGAVGVGFLLDQAGSDSYTSGNSGTNGGGVLGGVGFLLDPAGDDSYTAGGAGTNGGGSYGVGFLLDASGTDSYQTGSGPVAWDQTVVPKGTVGAQVDFAEPVVDHDVGCDPLVPGFGDTVSCWAWLEVNGDRVIDEEHSEPLPDGGGSQPQEKQFLHEDNVTVVPSQGVPPDDVNGTPTPDHPGTDPKETPDHNGTDPVPTPDHNGTDPVPTPEAGERVATVTVRDEGELVCVDVTPEGSGAMEVACLNRGFLGPADGHVPRGDTAVVYLSEEETPDVPGTPSQEVPDVPGTDPQPVPDVPGTPSQDVPDVPPVPGGSLGTTPHVTVSLDASYRYDPGRLSEGARVLGQGVWSPAGPGDEAWFLASGDDVGMTVTVSVHEDGEHVATVPVSVPYLGQALAAAEATAGTL